MRWPKQTRINKLPSKSETYNNDHDQCIKRRIADYAVKIHNHRRQDDGDFFFDYYSLVVVEVDRYQFPVKTNFRTKAEFD